MNPTKKILLASALTIISSVSLFSLPACAEEVRDENIGGEFVESNPEAAAEDSNLRAAGQDGEIDGEGLGFVLGGIENPNVDDAQILEDQMNPEPTVVWDEQQFP